MTSNATKTKPQRRRAYSRDPLVQAAYEYVKAVRWLRAMHRFKAHPLTIEVYEDMVRRARFALCEAVIGDRS
jgi:hypothetical protein